MTDRKAGAPPSNLLFLCTGNSARSILAEGLLNHLAAGRFKAFSAGSKPAGTPHAVALTTLQSHGIDTGFARSKSWDEFAGANAPSMDLVITVCGNAAGEVCPVWPGHPVTAHWGIDDPAAVTDPQAAVEAAFATAFERMKRRVEAFLALDVPASDNNDLSAYLPAIRAIGDLP